MLEVKPIEMFADSASPEQSIELKSSFEEGQTGASFDKDPSCLTSEQRMKEVYIKVQLQF